MLRLVFESHDARPLELLCIGAHSDDIEIGCGGTLLRLLHERPGTRVHWVVLSASAEREREARASAAAFLVDAGDIRVDVESFRESYFPHAGAAIKDYFEGLRQRIEPDLVFSHHRFDAHQDHRLVGELTWNTFRHHMVAEYEIPKYEGDLGQPNMFVALSKEIADRKISLISQHFGTQTARSWFRPETFSAIMTLRGVESGLAYAEGFHVRKLVI